MSNSRNNNVGLNINNQNKQNNNRRQVTSQPPINRRQGTSQQVPNYLNAIRVVSNILGGNNGDINLITPPMLNRNNGDINLITPPMLNRNVNDPITLNINNVEIPADVYELFRRITDDRRNRAQSSETTIEEVRRIRRRRDGLRNALNGVIDNFIGLSTDIDRLQMPIQGGMSRVDSTVSEGENKRGNNPEVNNPEVNV